MFRTMAYLSVAGLVALSPSVRADDQPKDIIAKAIKAHGGDETFTKYKAGTSRGKGKIDLPGIGEVDFTQESAHMLPDKFKESIELSVMGKNIRVLVMASGDTVHLEVANMVMKLDDKAKEELKEAPYRLKVGKLVPLLKEKEFEMSLIGEDKVEDKPVVGVRVVSKGHRDISLYFDKETHLLAKMETRTIAQGTGNEVNEERIIRAYEKNKDGIPVPKKVVVKHDSKKFLEIDISEVELLEKIDESEFKK